MNAVTEQISPVYTFTTNLTANVYATVSQESIKRSFDYVVDRCKLDSEEKVKAFYTTLIGVALDEIPAYRGFQCFSNTKITPPEVDEAAINAAAHMNRLTVHIDSVHSTIENCATDAFMLVLYLVKVISHLRVLGSKYNY